MFTTFCGEKWGILKIIAYFYRCKIPHKLYMSTFIGKYEAKTDAKGRIFLPSTYRKLLPEAERERIVMQRDLENDCVIFYPEEVWNSRVNDFKSRLDEWNPEDQFLLMQFVSDAEWLDIDAQGRVLLSKKHLQAMKVENNEVVFLGMIDRFSLWGKSRYEEVKMPQTNLAELLREKMKKQAP